MSMLSSQCDKLRKRAEMVDGLSPALASELRMAADTIWELRNVGAENAELRELVRDMMRFFEDDDACFHCGHDVECSEQSGLVLAYEEDCLMREVFKTRMRELGIEVEP